MNKTKIVEALISNDESVWTEEDRPFLMALNEEQLSSLSEGLTENRISEDNDGEELDQEGDSEDDESSSGKTDDVRGSKTVKGKAKVKAVKSVKCANEDEDESEESVDDYIANAPAAVREVLNESILSLNAEKQACVTTILANESNQFDKGELAAMSLNQLRKLAKLAAKPAKKVTANHQGLFAGQAPIVNEGKGEAEEFLPLPTLNWDKK